MKIMYSAAMDNTITAVCNVMFNRVKSRML